MNEWMNVNFTTVSSFSEHTTKIKINAHTKTMNERMPVLEFCLFLRLDFMRGWSKQI